MNAAVREVEFGNANQATEAVKESVRLADTLDTQVLAALVLARAGDPSQAQVLADSLERRFPQNAELNGYWLPSIRAAIQLHRRKPAEAIKTLEPTAPYELAYPRPQLEGGSLMYPAYLRGQAYLLLHQGSEAGGEFQKLIDQRAVVVNCPFGALAHLWLAVPTLLQATRSLRESPIKNSLVCGKTPTPTFPSSSLQRRNTRN